jgi:hypothetical protein
MIDRGVEDIATMCGDICGSEGDYLVWKTFVYCRGPLLLQSDISDSQGI